jgi:hypothetical protein
MKLTKRDREALQHCLDLVLNNRSDPASAQQAADLLTSDGWYETASFCSACVQRKSLGLQCKPWQTVPARGDRPQLPPEGRELLRRMLKAGISQYHPDPIAALAVEDAAA